MTLKEKLELFKKKGWTCNPETGEVYSHTGKLINKIGSRGYIKLAIRDNKNRYYIMAHQLVYFLYYDKVPNFVDHINHIKTDNRIVNLRDVNNSKNQMNRHPKYVKGYSWHKRDKKYQSTIRLNNKLIYLGQYDTEAEARQAYLSAKAKYHII